MTRPTKILVLMTVLAVLVLMPEGVWAQINNDLGSQRLGRAYWHVFTAYAIGWVLIFGWIISLVRRLARIERDVKAGD